MTTISIITPTLNRAATIRACLESVRSQDYNHIEHIVVDGQSTDATIRIVREYPHVGPCISEPDRGMYDAINKGIRLATGDVVGILNSDDVYANEHVLSRVAEEFQREKCEAVYGDLIYLDHKNDCNVIRRWRAGNYRHGAFKWGWMPPHPTFFVQRSLYDKYGGYNLQIEIAADYELMLRFIHKHHIAVSYIPAVLVKMRSGGVSNRSLGNRLKANAEDKRAWLINELKPFWFTRYLKPLRKVLQFVRI